MIVISPKDVIADEVLVGRDDVVIVISKDDAAYVAGVLFARRSLTATKLGDDFLSASEVEL